MTTQVRCGSSRCAGSAPGTRQLCSARHLSCAGKGIRSAFSRLRAGCAIKVHARRWIVTSDRALGSAFVAVSAPHCPVFHTAANFMNQGMFRWRDRAPVPNSTGCLAAGHFRTGERHRPDDYIQPSSGSETPLNRLPGGPASPRPSRHICASYGPDVADTPDGAKPSASNAYRKLRQPCTQRSTVVMAQAKANT